ncbi:MAG: hypothetical protein Q8M59_07955 [Tabrizicola sp.]|uniref:hypothetical protein n=1 Tax=Tabrizicola sp. TaxID=2005166 RepID=UPI002737640F|nr:hypothetical protein [Tabrizicola sp.]MDP3262885.1 hypothetical protein [Tabrizicola sp.]MDP3649082.1 hypothetical protein [Paracoccaceae bacterium]
MKLFVLAAPLGILLASGAIAQTTTEGATGATTGATTGGETSTMQSGSMTYGADWSDAVSSAFHSDAERTQLRTPDEIVASWRSLSQEDRDKILGECTRFKTDSNATSLTDGSSDATAGSDTSTSGDAATDTGADADAATGDATAGADATTGTATDNTGGGVTYDMNAMMVICPAIENL